MQVSRMTMRQYIIAMSATTYLTCLSIFAFANRLDLDEQTLNRLALGIPIVVVVNLLMSALLLRAVEKNQMDNT